MYLSAGVVSTWPAVRDAGSSFLAEGRAPLGEVSPGDHLQSAYRLWLPGHQLERAANPFVDPYSFRPESGPRANFAAWPFAIPYWPLERALGTVRAWNAFVLLGYALAGALAYAWLRALDLSRPAALAGGLVFALAPYRAAQMSAGHLLAPASALLPLALWALERRRTLLAAAALASIPLSGQLHLALGAIPFVALYAALTPTRRRATLQQTVARLAALLLPSLAAGLLVWALSVRGSVGETRSFAQVERYSAELADFVSRDVRHGLESFVFLGWLVPLLAVAGAAALAAARRGRLATILGAGAVVPALFALGANLPGYEALWRHTPGLHATRVPERLLPVACIAVAGLAAFALDRIHWPAVAAAALIAVVAIDLRAGVQLYRPSRADERNAAYAALRRAPPGRVLELPVFLPDRQQASVYLYYAMQAPPRERPAGYSTTAPPEADALMRRLQAVGCRRDARAFFGLVRRLGVRYLAVHRARRAGTSCAARARRHATEGAALIARDGGVTLRSVP